MLGRGFFHHPCYRYAWLESTILHCCGWCSHQFDQVDKALPLDSEEMDAIPYYTASWLIFYHCRFSFPIYKLQGKLLICYSIGEELMKIFANVCTSVNLYRIREWLMWKGDSGDHLVPPAAQLGPLRASCPALCPQGSGVFLRMETPQPPWATSLGNLCQCLVILTLKMCFLKVRVVFVCAHCLCWTEKSPLGTLLSGF